VDLSGVPLPDPDTPAPVGSCRTGASLLVHARRTAVLPEAHRPRVFSNRNPFSVGVYLVDGHAAGAWSWKAGSIVTQPFEDLDPRTRDEVEAERAALEAFHA